MAVILKTPEQIQQMRQAGRIVAKVLNRLGQMLAPGVTTEQLDVEAEKLCLQAGAKCLFKGVPGRGRAGAFPGSICVSINEQVVHGIPSEKEIRDGDVVSIDFGVEKDKWCADAAETFLVGTVDEKTVHLVDVTRNCLELARRMMQPGRKWSDIARAMQEYAEGEGFSVVREFVGHGIGQCMWEDTKIPNFVSRELQKCDIVLTEGMVMAVEPMVNSGSCHVLYAPDGWTVVTRDGKPSAHFEHTLAITADGVSALTEGC